MRIYLRQQTAGLQPSETTAATANACYTFVLIKLLLPENPNCSYSP
jgi:hypothetical protein